MKTRGARLLYDYWCNAKRECTVPARDAIEPRGLKDVLPWVFLLDHFDRELTTFRLAGTGLCDFYERELRGENFLSFWTGDCRRTVRSLIDNVTMMPAPSFIEFCAEAKNGRLLAGEIMLMPLAAREGTIRQILGGWFPAVTHDPLLEKPLVRQQVTNIRLLESTGPGVIPLPVLQSEDSGKGLRLVVSDGEVL